METVDPTPVPTTAVLTLGPRIVVEARDHSPVPSISPVTPNPRSTVVTVDPNPVPIVTIVTPGPTLTLAPKTTAMTHIPSRLDATPSPSGT